MSKVQNSQSRQFVISTIGDADRIDCHYFDPVYFNMIEKIEEIAKSSGFDVQTLEKLLDREVKPNFGAGETPLGAPYIPEGIPFVRIQNVDETGLDLSDVVFLPKQIYDHMHRWKLRAEDVLLTITGSFGVSCIVPKDMRDACLNQHVVRITVDRSKVIPEFLSLYLNSEYAQQQMNRDATGSTRFALDFPSIKRLKILLPKVPIQEDIVREVGRLFEAARSLKQEISKLESSYDTVVLDKLGIILPQEPKLKTFFASLADSDRIDVNWHYPFHDDLQRVLSKKKSRKLRNIQHRLQYGAAIDADYVSDVPFLRIENLRRNYLDLSDLQYVARIVYGDEIANLYLGEGDILIERSGTYVGLCSYVPAGMENLVYGSYIIKLRLEDKEVLPRYLSVFLNSILGRLQYDRLRTGSLQYNINYQHIRDVTIVEPEPELQEEIASTIFDMIAQVANLKSAYQLKLTEAKNRFTELLKPKTSNHAS